MLVKQQFKPSPIFHTWYKMYKPSKYGWFILVYDIVILTPLTFVDFQHPQAAQCDLHLQCTGVDSLTGAMGCSNGSQDISTAFECLNETLVINRLVVSGSNKPWAMTLGRPCFPKVYHRHQRIQSTWELHTINFTLDFVLHMLHGQSIAHIRSTAQVCFLL